MSRIDPDGGSTETQCTNSAGEVILDDGIDNGIIYRLSDDYFKASIGSDIMDFSTKIFDDGKWLGTPNEFVGFIVQQMGFIDNLNSNSLNIDRTPKRGGDFRFQISPLGTRNDFELVKFKDGEIPFSMSIDSGVTLRSIYNIRSALEHERRHIDQGFLGNFDFGTESFKLNRESVAYRRQIRGKWFPFSIESFQKGTRATLKDFTNQYWKIHFPN